MPALESSSVRKKEKKKKKKNLFVRVFLSPLSLLYIIVQNSQLST